MPAGPNEDLKNTPKEPELLEVPMSDGARISMHWYAASVSKAPAVLLMTPYRKEGVNLTNRAQWLNRAGYHFLVADVRGFGGSNAPYAGFLSSREVQDRCELVEWIARQTFCDGNVGLAGGSYCGSNQVLVAARKPKGLRCIAPEVNPLDTYRDWTHRGGIRCHMFWGLTFLNSQHRETERLGLPEYYLDVVYNPTDNARHQARSPEYMLSQIEVPVFCIGGWHDYFLRPSVRTFQGVKGPKRLLIGPWGHGEIPESVRIEELLRWYDYWLRGAGENPSMGKRVRLFRTGIDEWQEQEDWFDSRKLNWREWRPVPAPRSVRVVSHIAALPPALNPRKQFLLDGAFASGMSNWGEDVTFDSEPCTENLDLGGPVGLEAVLSVQACDDVDVHARLSVVKTNGDCQQLTEGRLRAGHRAIDLNRSQLTKDGIPIVPWHPHDKEELMPQGEAVKLNIEIYPIAHRLFRGERLRLGLSLARADESAAPAKATLLPETRVWLPLS